MATTGPHGRAGDAAGDPADIQDVVDGLQAIVDRSIATEHRDGYFAALYLAVTRSIQRAIDAGSFDDGARMNAFDVAFAKHYFRARTDFRQEAGSSCPDSWQVALHAADRWPPLVMQHLLLGINAHINLDLGIATAETAPGEALPALRHDYDLINEILGAVVNRVQARLVEVSPWLGWVERFEPHDETVIRFSIARARADAWTFATELAPLDPRDWRGPVRDRDVRVSALGRRVARPGWLRLALLPVRLRERRGVGEIVAFLADTEPLDEADLADLEGGIRP